MNREKAITRPKLTAKQRATERRNFLHSKGLGRVELWVPSQHIPLMHFVASRLRDHAVITISPGQLNTDPFPGKQYMELYEMEAVSSPWNIFSLKEALERSEDLLDGEFELTINEGAEAVLEVIVEAAGGTRLFVAINGEQVITSTVLWPRDAIDDPAAFEAMMLRSHKNLLPLCALSIDRVGDREYYELFGSMSARSSLHSVITEMRTLANNAIELANEVGPKATVA